MNINDISSLITLFSLVRGSLGGSGNEKKGYGWCVWRGMLSHTSPQGMRHDFTFESYTHSVF